jgi:2-hydroxy-4-carboxymuconate semialdehyde hemiacetal dehydrogenase
MRDRVRLCMVGHGMMGTWHSEALKSRPDCEFHMLVGKEAESAGEFARRYGYRRVTTDYAAALADPEVDAVILATPSEDHARMALAAIEARKPLLLEIPIAMTLEGADRVTEAAEAAGVMLAMSHPMRFRESRRDLIARIASGEERPRLVHGRFFIHRLENIGATGLRRAWTDNILWHHTTHLIDFGLFLLGGGDPERAEARIRHMESFMPPPDPRTGIPMEIVIAIETEDDQTILASGSYYSRERIYETMAVTERDSYRVDELAATMTTGAGTEPIESEERNAFRVSHDFLDALREGRPPFVTARSVLPAMRILDKAQRAWDHRHGARPIPGRPLDRTVL